MGSPQKGQKVRYVRTLTWGSTELSLLQEYLLCFVCSNGAARKKETRQEWKAFSNFIYNCHSDKK